LPSSLADRDALDDSSEDETDAPDEPGDRGD